jgi:hypothetical protein
MDVDVAIAIWRGLLAYAAVGAIAALWMLAGGLKRIDPLAAAAPLRVKLLLAPGLIALWPAMLVLRLRARRSRPA